MNASELFGPVISTYSRQQAIEDGMLVQLSGPGYQGEEWVPKMIGEAGFKWPVAMTTAAFTEFVTPILDYDGNSESGAQLAPCQDAEGRLWDVLWMTKLAIRASRGGSELLVTVHVVPNVPVGSKRTPRPVKRQIKLVTGPGDCGEPVMTFMLPSED
jgi:hypothetical protein